MAMVVVDASCLKQADSQPKSGGLVWGSSAAWRWSTFIKWTEWTLAMTLWSWWQHYKHCHGYYYYYYYYLPSRCWSDRSQGQNFSKRAFRFSAPSVSISPACTQTVLISDSLSIFKSRLRTFFIHSVFRWTLIRPAASACWSYDRMAL